MYADLNIIRVPWESKETLPTSDVLAIAICHPGKPKKRRQVVFEHDYYILVWDDERCYLGGYNDDFYWFSLTAPHGRYGIGFVHQFPFLMPERAILFHGIMIDKHQYKAAKTIFTDREGAMA